MKYLVLDFETTGLDPVQNEPTQVAAMLLDDKLRELAAFATLIKPVRLETIRDEALAIQGRTLDDFTHAMSAPAAFALLVDFVATLPEPPIVVGHNVEFDLAFLRQCELQYGFHVPRKPVAIDTCYLARLHLQARGQTTDAKLVTLTAYYGFAHQAHDALGDVRATAQVLTRIQADASELVARALEGTLLTGLVADAQAASSGNAFVNSCDSQLQAKGYLSPKQITALVRVIEGSPSMEATRSVPQVLHYK